MDINKLAEEWLDKTKKVFYQEYSDSFDTAININDARDLIIKGYLAATTWYDMDSAPKDGTEILILTEKENIIICHWSEKEYKWAISDSFDIDNPIQYDSPASKLVKWTHLPKYNP